MIPPVNKIEPMILPSPVDILLIWAKTPFHPGNCHVRIPSKQRQIAHVRFVDKFFITYSSYLDWLLLSSTWKCGWEIASSFWVSKIVLDNVSCHEFFYFSFSFAITAKTNIRRINTTTASSGQNKMDSTILATSHVKLMKGSKSIPNNSVIWEIRKHFHPRPS